MSGGSSDTILKEKKGYKISFILQLLLFKNSLKVKNKSQASKIIFLCMILKI